MSPMFNSKGNHFSPFLKSNVGFFVSGLGPNEGLSFFSFNLFLLFVLSIFSSISAYAICVLVKKINTLTINSYVLFLSKYLKCVWMLQRGRV